MSAVDGQLKLLSLDGGGVRGLSLIIILEHLMDRANRKRQALGLEPQEPWQTFHLIGGTSTGGIIAIMLGRLRMSLADCRVAYEALSKQAFTPLHYQANFFASIRGLWSAGPSFDVKELENAIHTVIRDNLKHGESDPDQALLKETEVGDEFSSPCKVLVACTHEDITKLAVFRSYLHPTKVRRKIFDKCLIWQACRATSAAPTFFPPIEIEGQKFLDGGMVFNNPVHIVYREAREIWPDQEPLLISIGTGDAPMEEFGQNLVQVVKTLKNIATETEETANTFLEGEGRALAKHNRYYRFNVPTLGTIGLQEWKATGKITTLTEHYLDMGEMADKTAACVQKLSEVISKVEATNNQRKLRWLSDRALALPPRPQTHNIPAEEFGSGGEGNLDTDFPGRYYWYRETIDTNGFPAGVRVDPQFVGRKTRPVSNTIITCRRTCDLQIRGQAQWITPGLYKVIWIFWFVAGRDCPVVPPNAFIPKHPQENSVRERFFPSTIGVDVEAPPKLDSAYFYPWSLHCSVGRPKRSREFLHTQFDLDQNPLAAPVLLMEGFREYCMDPGTWNTLRNTGWCELPGPIFEVTSDGEVAFVISKPWERKWVGGFSFGGVRLEPL